MNLIWYSNNLIKIRLKRYENICNITLLVLFIGLDQNGTVPFVVQLIQRTKRRTAQILGIRADLYQVKYAFFFNPVEIISIILRLYIIVLSLWIHMSCDYMLYGFFVNEWKHFYKTKMNICKCNLIENSNTSEYIVFISA